MSSFAQKSELKELDYKQQIIEIELQDIDLLEINHSEDKKISILMQDYAENPTELDIKSNQDLISITASRAKLFQDDLAINKFCYEQPLFPAFKLTLPKGCQVLITDSNGNIKVYNFNGDLTLRLNTGEVTIDEFKGSINAELFSGNINAKIKNTETNAVSYHGKITTTFSTTNWQKSDNSLKGTFGIRKNLLTIQSINANIMLNNSTTQ